MQVGVHPGAVLRFDLLSQVVRLVPVALCVVPERLQERRHPGGRRLGAGQGLTEFIQRHALFDCSAASPPGGGGRIARQGSRDRRRIAVCGFANWSRRRGRWGRSADVSKKSGGWRRSWSASRRKK